MGAVTVACPGTKSYEILPDYHIAVEGVIPVWDAATATGKYKIAALKTIIDMHGERILRYSNKYGFPAAWTAGIIGIETVPPGNPNSCSPSRPGGCGSGAACCAYGLMQFIKSTAQSYGLPGGEPLLGNAELAIDLGVQELMKKSKRYGMDIVKIAGPIMLAAGFASAPTTGSATVRSRTTQSRWCFLRTRPWPWVLALGRPVRFSLSLKVRRWGP